MIRGPCPMRCYDQSQGQPCCRRQPSFMWIVGWKAFAWLGVAVFEHQWAGSPRVLGVSAYINVSQISISRKILAWRCRQWASPASMRTELHQKMGAVKEPCMRPGSMAVLSSHGHKREANPLCPQAQPQRATVCSFT